MGNRFLIGATYYPEHWLVKGSPSRGENHARDLDRMAAAGFNVVRLGEGAWWYWEPREGEYRFELFDRVIALCRERDIKVIMGTPTYTGPAWIMQKYPEVLRVNFDRVVMKHGSRQNYCHTSPMFRELSRRITTALANHYANEKQVIAWQLDNEINNGVDASYTEADAVAFRAWLRAKYKTLDALNDAWGTRFWSQVYDDWEQIDLPAPMSQWPNPTRLLDHSRFVSDSAIAFLDEQRAILKKANPDWRVTHNGLFGNIDPPAFGKILDFYSHDHYPLFWKTWPEFAGKLVESRSVSFPFAIMEQQSGPGGQMGYLLRTPEPGEMRLWTYQSIAHGADKLLYFTWRTCPFGSEQHWHGILDQDGKDNRRLREAAETARELAMLPEEFFDARPVKCVGVLRDYDVDVNEKRINTYTHDGRWGYGRWAAAFMRRHVPVDYVWPGDSFDEYAVIVVGHQKVMDEALAAKLKQFAEAGGTVIIGAQSGLHDRNLHIVQQTPPGLLADLAGAEVEDWTSLEKGRTRSIALERGPALSAIAFVETLRATTAIVMGRWNNAGFVSGKPAVTRNPFGQGAVIYLGAYLDLPGTQAFVDSMLDAKEFIPEFDRTVEASEAVECVARDAGGTTYLCLLNHSAEPQAVNGLEAGAVSVLGPKVAGRRISLDPYGVAIVKA